MNIKQGTHSRKNLFRLISVKSEDSRPHVTRPFNTKPPKIVQLDHRIGANVIGDRFRNLINAIAITTVK